MLVILDSLLWKMISSFLSWFLKKITTGELKFLAALSRGSVCWGSAWRIWRQEEHSETGVVFSPSPTPSPLEVAGKAEPLYCYHRIYIAYGRSYSRAKGATYWQTSAASQITGKGREGSNCSNSIPEALPCYCCSTTAGACKHTLQSRDNHLKNKKA